MSIQIVRYFMKQYTIFMSTYETMVTVLTEDTSYLSCTMIVIYGEILFFFFFGFTTDRTTISLVR